MSRLLETWCKTQVPHPGGCGLVSIYTPGQCTPELKDQALKLLSGRAEALELIREHPWGGKVYRVTNPNQAACYFKHFDPKSPASLYKCRRARKTLEQEKAAQSHDFTVPEALLYARHHSMGVTRSTLLVHASVTQYDSVFRMLNKPRPGKDLTYSQKNLLAKNLGAEIGRWHKAQLFHGDLHLNNIWSTPEEDFSTFAWIDHEEGRARTTLGYTERLHDLIHVNRGRHQLSLTQRMRIWKGYLATCPLDAPIRRRLLRDIVKASRKYWAKRNWL